MKTSLKALGAIFTSVCLATLGSPAFAVTVGPDRCEQVVEDATGVVVEATSLEDVDYCVVTFSSVGLNAWTVPADVAEIEYLIVGGGGGGGNAFGAGPGGGGGAGGLLTGSLSVEADAVLQIEVGTGGAGGAGTTDGTQAANNGANGEPSVLDALEAFGGGGGGARGVNGLDGASGGGAGVRPISPSTRVGGSGTPGQGNAGAGSTWTDGAGGGGGAGGAGSTGVSTAGGLGGVGVSSEITGVALTFAEGGQGGAKVGSFTEGADATAGTGNGGGGATLTAESPAILNSIAGGDGASGLVVVRYALAEELASTGIDPKAALGVASIAIVAGIAALTRSRSFALATKVSFQK